MKVCYVILNKEAAMDHFTFTTPHYCYIVSRWLFFKHNYSVK